MSRLLTAAAVMLMLASSTVSQQSNAAANENTLYSRALFAGLEKMQKAWGKFELTGKEGSRIDANYHQMIVERNRGITDGLPAQSGDYRVEYLWPQELIDRYKRVRKEFPILVGHPMVNDGARLKITFNLCWFSYNKRSMNYALSDWAIVYFRYDCEKHQFVLDEVTLGGI